MGEPVQVENERPMLTQVMLPKVVVEHVREREQTLPPSKKKRGQVTLLLPVASLFVGTIFFLMACPAMVWVMASPKNLTVDLLLDFTLGPIFLLVSVLSFCQWFEQQAREAR